MSIKAAREIAYCTALVCCGFAVGSAMADRDWGSSLAVASGALVLVGMRTADCLGSGRLGVRR